MSVASEQSDKQVYLSTCVSSKVIRCSVGTVRSYGRKPVSSLLVKTAGGHRPHLPKNQFRQCKASGDKGVLTAQLPKREYDMNRGSKPEAVHAIKTNILIAEDDPVMQKVYEHTLRSLRARRQYSLCV